MSRPTPKALRRYWLADQNALDALEAAIDKPDWPFGAVPTTVFVLDPVIHPGIESFVTDSALVDVINVDTKTSLADTLTAALQDETASLVQITRHATLDFPVSVEVLAERVARCEGRVFEVDMVKLERDFLRLEDMGAMPERMWIAPKMLLHALEMVDGPTSLDGLPQLIERAVKQVGESTRLPLIAGAFACDGENKSDEGLKYRAQLAHIWLSHDNDMAIQRYEFSNRIDALKAEKERVRQALQEMLHKQKSQIKKRVDAMSAAHTAELDRLKQAQDKQIVAHKKMQTVAQKEISRLTDANSALRSRFSSQADTMQRRALAKNRGLRMMINGSAQMAMDIDGRSVPTRWPSPPWGGLAASITATQSGFWSRAMHLWRDLAHEPRCRFAAAHCAAEAALHAGRFGLADLMVARIDTLGEALEKLIEQNHIVRNNRKTWFATLSERNFEIDPIERLERMLDLELYRDVLSATRTSSPMDAEVREAFHIRALYGLGAHHQIADIANEAESNSPELEELLRSSESKLALWNEPVSSHVSRFVENHPAALKLRPYVEALVRENP